ncbi:SDR family oxidoreductase [Halosimplex litoreum]|uniref:SDR family oxidoreductase n=1 Tax=Halosimplex litoreum TaxID=1198301 RepID=A0A7T3KW41_9EURY|nr:SDR family oxidoreductase [Halosimplex litoreum]QPV63927.1 SDR family oxidoreductase [Halosimplex litoreum]
MRVAILGCGYVGIELGRQLTNAGHDAVGVRRSDSGVEAIESAGFAGVRADVTDEEALTAVPDAEAVVFAASSGGRGAEAAREVYVEGLQTAVDHFCDREDAPDRFVYTSSTGVYGDHDGEWVDEGTPIEPTTAKTEVLAEAERIAVERPAEYGVDGTVARYAGLYGPDRYRLERYVEGPVTEGYLNMVHRDDAAGAVGYLLESDLARGEAVNVVDDEPVAKWEFADWLAEQCCEPEPPKRTIEARLAAEDLSETVERRLRTSKRVSNQRLRGLEYEFAFPTYREGYRAAVDGYLAADDGTT